MVIVLIEKNCLSFGACHPFGNLQSSKTATNNNNAGFAQVCNTRARGYQFGHLKRILALKRVQFTGCRRISSDLNFFFVLEAFTDVNPVIL